MIRLLPEPSVDGDDVDAVVSAAGFAAEGHVPAGLASPEQWPWAHPDGTAVTWVVDGIIGLAYVVVDGSREASVAELLSTRLAMVDWHDALVDLHAAQEWDELVEHLYRLAVAAPGEFSSPVAEEVAGLASHDNPVVRQAAYVAILYLGWPALMGLVRAAAADDPDPANRDLARSLVRRSGGGAGQPTAGGRGPS